MEIASNKKLYILVAVLGVFVLSFLFVLVFLKKNSEIKTVNEEEILKKFTTSTENVKENEEDPEKEKLKQMIGATEESSESKEDIPVLEEELQKKLTPPN